MLDVKNILAETVSHHMLPQMLASPLWVDLSNLLKDYLKFMDDHFRESAELTFVAYRHRSYSKVSKTHIDFIAKTWQARPTAVFSIDIYSSILVQCAFPVFCMLKNVLVAMFLVFSYIFFELDAIIFWHFEPSLVSLCR